MKGTSMNQLRLSLVIALLVSLMPTAAFAEDAAAPASATLPAEPAPQAASAPAAIAGGDALAALDNLDFASGEVVTFDPAGGALAVKVYLDATGDANEQTLTLSVDPKTEITNGETELQSDSLKVGAEIDVEYDVNTKKATYIFIY